MFVHMLFALLLGLSRRGGLILFLSASDWMCRGADEKWLDVAGETGRSHDKKPGCPDRPPLHGDDTARLVSVRRCAGYADAA